MQPKGLNSFPALHIVVAMVALTVSVSLLRSAFQRTVSDLTLSVSLILVMVFAALQM